MIKISTLFVRDFEGKDQGDFTLTSTVNPGCEWVIKGEGLATRKWDGMAVKYQDGQWFKRYDAKAFTINKSTGVKQEYDRKPPVGFEPTQDPDPITGHWPGWVPCKLPEDKALYEALEYYVIGDLTQEQVFDNGGTYELIGPKIGTRGGKNPENQSRHYICKHGDVVYRDCPRTFEGLRDFLQYENIEGIVFHHPDGRMCKIKKSDFGFKR